jgi:hypothetical protein
MCNTDQISLGWWIRAGNIQHTLKTGNCSVKIWEEHNTQLHGFMCRWEDKSKTNFIDIKSQNTDWLHVVHNCDWQQALMMTGLHLLLHYRWEIFFKWLVNTGFSKRFSSVILVTKLWSLEGLEDGFIFCLQSKCTACKPNMVCHRGVVKSSSTS